MTKPQIKEIIYNTIFANSFLPQDVNINDDSLLKECGMDSFTIVSLIVALEEIFSFEFSDEDLSFDQLRSVSAISNIIAKHIEVKK